MYAPHKYVSVKTDRIYSNNSNIYIYLTANGLSPGGSG